MSHPREPAAHVDRREGGRHGRPGPRTVQPLPETRIRRQLLRTAVLPAVAVGLCGAAAVLFTLQASGARPTPALWAVLTGAGVVALAGIGAAVVAASRTARSMIERLSGLRRSSARGQVELRGLVERLRRGDGPPTRREPAVPPGQGDEIDQLGHELNRAHDLAVATVVQATQLSSHAGSEQKVEVFVNLARRLQSLVHREIQLLDDLENSVEDPELLKGLFHVDHLATRIRRHAENLAVLGGAISRRQWSNPVTMTEVLRSSIAEVEQYSRVKLVPPIDGALRGHAVADVIHLLAELVENASVFSAPHTPVLLRASHVTAGLAVEVEDRGLGMPVSEQNKMNELLSDPDQVNVASLLSDGRIGLFVVAALARRHGVAVRLQNNIYGGVQAVIVLPQGLLGAEPSDTKQNPVGKQNPAAKQAQPTPQTQQPQQPLQSQHPQQALPERESAPAAATPPPARRRIAATPSPVDVPEPVRSPGPVPAEVPAPAPQTAMAPFPQQPQRDATPAGLVNGAADPTTTTPGAGKPGPRHANSPLPVRSAHEERPNPAEAVPGARAAEPYAAPEPPAPAPTPTQATPTQATAPQTASTQHPPAPPATELGPTEPSPTDPDPTVRGTMGRPQLPKRRAMEHLVPQLRDAPVARQDHGHLVGHDPGLMAAFQRGIGLAEAQGELDTPQQPDPLDQPVQTDRAGPGQGPA